VNLAGVLSGGGADFFGSLMATYFLDATLYAQVPTYNSYGDLTIVETSYPCLAQVDAMTESMRAEQGASDTDRAIYILSTSTSADITTDFEVVVNAGPYAGVRFQIASINSDPVAAYRLLRGTRAS